MSIAATELNKPDLAAQALFDEWVKSPDGRNAFVWAGTPIAEHRNGAMWGAYHAGFRAALEFGKHNITLVLDTSDAIEALASLLSPAAIDALKERARQIEAEGWTEEHDDAHENGELALAASCYMAHPRGGAVPVPGKGKRTIPDLWPWDAEWWKPGGKALADYRARLVKGVALGLAEIERVDRIGDETAQAAVEGGGATVAGLDGEPIDVATIGDFDDRAGGGKRTNY